MKWSDTQKCHLGSSYRAKVFRKVLHNLQIVEIKDFGSRKIISNICFVMVVPVFRGAMDLFELTGYPDSVSTFYFRRQIAPNFVT